MKVYLKNYMKQHFSKTKLNDLPFKKENEDNLYRTCFILDSKMYTTIRF